MAYDLEAIRNKYSSNSSNAAAPVSSGQGTSNNVNYSYNAGGVSVGNSSLEDLRRRYSYEPKTVTARTITSNDQARLRQQALQAGTVNEEEEKKKNKKIFGEGGVLSDAWNWIKGGMKSGFAGQVGFVGSAMDKLDDAGFYDSNLFKNRANPADQYKRQADYYQSLYEKTGNEQYKKLALANSSLYEKIGEGYQQFTPQESAKTLRDLSYDLDTKAQEDIEKGMVGRGTAGQLIGQGVVSGTGMLMDYVSGGGLANMFIRSYGNSYNEAKRQGISEDKLDTYALTHAAVEVISEKIFEGPWAKIYGKGGLANSIKGLNRVLGGNSSIASTLLKNFAEEGAEEVAAQLMDYAIDKGLGFRPDNWSADDWTELWQSFVVGGGMGLLGGGANVIRGTALGNQYRGQAQDIINEGLTYESGTAARDLAERLNNTTPGGYQIYRQIEENQNAYDRLNDTAKIQQAARQLGLDEEQTRILQDDYEIAKQAGRRGQKTNVEKYIAGVKEAYNYAKYGASIEDAAENGAFKNDINETQRQHAYKFGEMARDAADNVTLDKSATVTVEGVTGSIEGIERKGSAVSVQIKGSDGNVETVEINNMDETPKAVQVISDAFGEAAGAVYKAYDGKQNFNEFIQAARIVRSAALNSSVAWDAFSKTARAKSIGKTLTMAQKESIWTAVQRTQEHAAKMDSIKASNAAGTQTAGKVNIYGGKVDSRSFTVNVTRGGKTSSIKFEGYDQSKAQKGSVEAKFITVAKAVARMTGVDVRLFYDESGNMGIHRRVDPETGRETIGINMANIDASGNALMVKTMSHELTHFIQANSSKDYQALKTFMFDKLLEKNEGMTLEDLIQSKIDREGISATQAEDEVVADGCEMMLKDSKVFTELARENMTLAQKIKSWLDDFITTLRSLYGDQDADYEEARYLMQWATDLQKLWDRGLKNAVINRAAAEAETEAPAENSITGVSETINNVEETTQMSYRSLAQAAGFEAVRGADGERYWAYNGKRVRKITTEDIRKSPIGAMITASIKSDSFKNGISKEDADKQIQFFTDICNMAANTRSFAMTMKFAGSAAFTALKANSDKQYGTTYDFPSICTKTQAMIDAMSADMVKKGRGLSRQEIVDLYRRVFASGNPVNCPECYVFSRWIGIGGLLDNIKKYQDKYCSMTPVQVRAEFNKLADEITAFAAQNGLSFGKAKGKIAENAQKKYNKLLEKIEKAENQGEPVKDSDRELLKKFEDQYTTAKAMTWIQNVYFAGDLSSNKMNPKARVPVDVLFDLNKGDSFAIDYPEAWDFRTTQGAGYGKAITPYAEAVIGEGIMTTASQKFIDQKKAYARESGGETIDNPFLHVNSDGTLTKDAMKQLESARKKMRAQNFKGGQRYSSTSDARPDTFSDFLLACLETQAMGGMVQVYTKVTGAVDAYNTWGFSSNMSLMPKFGGLDADGNIIDTAVGGMSPVTAEMLRNRNEQAGTITIGVNDEHIISMMEDGRTMGPLGKAIKVVRDFIIPYHASGGKAETVDEMRAIQEGIDKNNKISKIHSTDYTRTQGDKVLSDTALKNVSEELWGKKLSDKDIELIHKRRAARIAILCGPGKGKVKRALDMDVIRGSRYLSNLYEKFNGGEWTGITLSKGDVESQIYPNEFWDKSVTYENSGKITQDYLNYCEELGFLHRFSGRVINSTANLSWATGYDKNGKPVKLTDLAYVADENGKPTKQIRPFFWKTLTDRRMYGADGNYLEQKIANLTVTPTELMPSTSLNKGEFGKAVDESREYDKAASDKLVAEIREEDAQLSRRTPKETSNDTESLHIKEVIRQNAGKLNSMEPVAKITVPKIDWANVQSVKKWVSGLKSLEAKYIDVKGFGRIDVGLKRISNGFKYAKTPGERAAIAAIPRVLKDGIISYENPNHKDRNYGTYVFTAPVVLNGARGNMGIAVIKTNENHYRAHRILTPENTEFVIEYKETEPQRMGAKPEAGLHATSGSSANIKISQLSEEVKNYTAEEKDETDIDTQYSVRTKPAPEHKQYGFKLMVVDNQGLPHAMFVDANKALKYGTWYDADSPLMKDMLKLEPGDYLVGKDGKATKVDKVTKAMITEAPEGSRYMKVGQYADGSKSFDNYGINGSGSKSTFALRPGWHLTDNPSMRHIGAEPDASNSPTTRRNNQRWFLVEYATDKDYNQEAFHNKRKDIPDHVPTDGWYSFQTNSRAEAKQHWLISGSIRIVGPISEEAAAKLSESKGIQRDLPYKYGKAFSEDDVVDLDDYIQNSGVDATPSKSEMRARIENSEKTSGLEIKNGTARWTKDRIDYLYDEYASTAQNYSKAYATFISPEDFLSLTTANLSRIESESRELNQEELKGYRQAIYLTYDPSEPGVVAGHEGRHRMVALRNAGIKQVPIAIQFYGEEGKSNRQPLEQLELSGQEFNSGKAPGHVILKDLVPISRAYRNEIEEKFGANGTEDVQFSTRELVDEVRNINIEGAKDYHKTVGVGFSTKLARKGRAEIIGHTISNSKELAEIAQVYRDPRFETLRWFFTDKDGKVVFQTGVTASTPGTTPITDSETASGQIEYLFDLMEAATARGATGVYLEHNHPGGDPTPSEQDIDATKYIVKFINDFSKMSQGRELAFKGHAVIDTTRYATIDENGSCEFGDLSAEAVDRNIKSMTPDMPHPILGTIVNSNDKLAAAAKSVQANRNLSTVLYADSSTFEVRGIEEFNNMYGNLRRLIDNGKKRFGAERTFIATTDPEIFDKIEALIKEGRVTDAVILSGDGEARTSDYVDIHRIDPTFYNADGSYKKGIKRVGDAEFSVRDENLTEEQRKTVRDQVEKETRRIERENARLKERVEYWKSQTKRSDEINAKWSNVKRLTRDLRETYNVQDDAEAATRNIINEMATEILRDNYDIDKIRKDADALAGDMISHAEVELGDGITVNPYAKDIEGWTQIAREDIVQALLGGAVGPEETFADRKAREIKNLKAQNKAKIQAVKETYQERLKRLRAEKNARIAQIMKEDAIDKAAALAKLRAEKNAQMVQLQKDMAQHQREVKAGQKERKARTETRNKILKLQKKFQQMYEHPKQGSNQHVPTKLSGAVIDLINILNESEIRRNERMAGRTQSQFRREQLTKAAEKLNNLAQTYSNLKGDDLYGGVYDEGIKAMLDNISKALSLGDMGQLDSATLNDIYVMMKAMHHVIVNQNRAINEEYIKGIKETGEQLRDEILSTKNSHPKLNKYLMVQARPDTFWQMICGYKKGNAGEKIQKMFVAGEERMLKLQQQMYYIQEPLFEKYKAEMNEMTGKPLARMYDIGLKDMDGKTLKVTRGQMLSIYMHMNCADNMEALITGGLLVPDGKSYYKDGSGFGRGVTNSYAVGRKIEVLQKEAADLREAMAENGEMSEAEVQNSESRINECLDEIDRLRNEMIDYLAEMKKSIESQLTAFDKELMDIAAQGFQMGADAINEQTEKMYGYKKATVENYFPMHRDLTMVITSPSEAAQRDASQINLQNSGVLKERVKSRAPIQLTDILKEMDNHSEKASRISGFMSVQRDFDHIYNVRPAGSDISVEGAVTRIWGNDKSKWLASGDQYIQNYLQSIAGANHADGFFGRIRSNTVRATLALNLRVAMSQLASIPTAAAEVGWGNMMKGYARAAVQAFNPQAKQKLAKENAWFWQRYKGSGGMREIGEVKRINGKFDLIGKFENTGVGKALMNWCQMFDCYATYTMWAMAEEQAKSEGLKTGTDEFKTRTEEVYRNIIRRTQPNYTDTERSDLLRDKSEMKKFLTMYKTQSNQNLNILVEAAGKYRAGSGSKAEVANAYTAVIIGGNVAFAGLRALANWILRGFKPKDDEDQSNTFGADVASGVLNMLMGGSNVYDFISGLSGKYYYGVEDSALGAISDVLTKSVKYGNYLFEGKGLYPSQVNSLMKQYAKALGIPLSNAEKIVEAFGADLFSSDEKLFQNRENKIKEMTQAELANAVKAGEATEEEFNNKYSKDYSDYIKSSSYVKANAKIELSQSEVKYDASNWEKAFGDSTVSANDKDNLMLVYGGGYLKKPYSNVRNLGYSPEDTYRMIETMDINNNDSVTQEEVYRYISSRYSYNEAERIWDAITAAQGWQSKGVPRSYAYAVGKFG